MNADTGKELPSTAVIGEPEFIKNILRPMTAVEGNSLPVSAFNGREDGHFPQGTAAYEKRCIAVDVPEWQIDNCIQCNQCSLVCPSGALATSSSVNKNGLIAA